MTLYGLNYRGRWLARSYSSYGGRVAVMGYDKWAKQPMSWRTKEGAEEYRNGKEWLKGYSVAELPLSPHESYRALHSAAPALLKACKMMIEGGYLAACPEAFRQFVSDTVAKAETRISDRIDG